MIEWRPVLGYEDLYVVSNAGDVRTADGRVILGTDNEKGYVRVTLTKNGVRNTFKVSRLVALAFLANPDNKPEVNHKSGVKANNSSDNLEWATHAENIQHAYDMGLKHARSNENHPMCKLSNEQVQYIREHCALGASRREMQELFGVSKRQIQRIVNLTSRVL